MSDNSSELKSKLRDSEMKGREQTVELRDLKSRSVRLAAGSAIAGFLLFAIGGQWFPGYQLDSTAEANANQMAAAAVTELKAQYCAENFMRTAGLETRLAAWNEVKGGWDKASFIRDGAWAATPDGEKADYVTAEKCRDLIAERVSAKSAKAS